MGPSANDDPTRLLTVAEVASRLRVSKRTVYRFLREAEAEKRACVYRVGRQWRIHPSAIRVLFLREPKPPS